MSGTRVSAEDLDSGETDSATVTDNYILVCDGSCYVSSTQHYANGTVVITVKGVK